MEARGSEIAKIMNDEVIKYLFSQKGIAKIINEIGKKIVPRESLLISWKLFSWLFL